MEAFALLLASCIDAGTALALASL
ncbi:MAG: hypothetical protein RL033_1738, partial [Pseudomonadota bacterium]